jgi:integrase
MSGQGRQAKVLSDAQVRAALGHVGSVSRYPERDRVMILLSVKAGLRAKEIASLTWSMVADAQGQLGEAIHLPNSASKGKNGGRTVPLNPALHHALEALRSKRGDDAGHTRGSSTASAERVTRLPPFRFGLRGSTVRSASTAPHPTAGAGRSLPRRPSGSSRPAVACGIFRSSPATAALPRRSGISRATAGRSRTSSG